MRAEVALLSGVVFGIDEDRVVGTGGDARLAADAGRLVEVHDAVRPFEHGRGRAGGYTRRVRALIAASDLERAPGLRKDADVDGLDVRPRNPQRHLVLGLACGRAGMTADAASLVDDLDPVRTGCLELNER